jgi:hypothetical protein
VETTRPICVLFMESLDYCARKLNNLVSWCDQGFLYRNEPCSTDFVKNILNTVEKELGFRFKTKFVFTPDGCSNVSDNADSDDLDESYDSEHSSVEEDPESINGEDEESLDQYSCLNKKRVLENVKRISHRSDYKLPSSPYIKKDVTKRFRHVQQPHKIISGTSRSLSCSRCEQQFSTKSSMVRHTLSQHSRRKFECPACGRPFARLDGMKLHSLICKISRDSSFSDSNMTDIAKPIVSSGVRGKEIINSKLS